MLPRFLERHQLGAVVLNVAVAPNETGKGDHRHYGRREERYGFESVEKLLVDFRL